MMPYLIASAVVAIVAALLIVPLFSKNKDGGPSMSTRLKVIFGLFIIAFIITAATVYVTKMDMKIGRAHV